MREDAGLIDAPSIALIYDPQAPLDKALPEAISAHGLKREPLERTDHRPSLGLAGPSDRPCPSGLHGLGAEVLRDLDLRPGDVLAARHAAKRNRTDIGRELVAARVVDEETIASAIARALGVPAEAIARKDGIVRSGDEDAALPAPGRRHRFLKTCDRGLGPKLFLAPQIEEVDSVHRLLAAHPEKRPYARVATPRAIARHIAQGSATQRAEAARLSLSGERPEFSARHVLTGLQGILVASVLMALLGVAILMPGTVLAVLHILVIPLFFGAVALRFAAAAMLLAEPGDRSARLAPVHPDVVDGVRPVYSVLVALHRESEVVPDLVGALASLEWPRSKLEVFFVCEGDDAETISAVERAIQQEPGFEIVVVPPSLPRTKPKALNFALPLATGEFVVLYDAEDRPRADQLEAAFRAMRAGGAELACLQAPLVVRNGERNWLAGHFALEYAALFRGFLPFLSRMRLPLPLGGTSNHFRREALLSVGGWDSHNVTEDADLGIRLCRAGYLTQTIDVPTFEDAPERWQDWRNQRTRWMKGWMQTWLVHMRNPPRLLHELGAGGFVAVQLLFFGMIASTLAHPFFLAFLAYTAWTVGVSGMPDIATRVLVAIDLFNLVFGYLAFALLAAKSLDPTESRTLRRHLWSLYAYWFLISLASARAFLQLIRDPHKWEKTPHGPSARANEATPSSWWRNGTRTGD